MTQNMQNFDTYLQHTGEAIASLRNAKKYLDLLTSSGNEPTQHNERVNYIIKLIQEHTRLHLEEFGIMEAKLHLKSQTKQTTEKLMRQIKTKEQDILPDQKMWDRRMDPKNLVLTNVPMDIETWTSKNCQNNERLICRCCDRYANYLIEHWKLDMAFNLIKNMPEGPQKRKEVWQRLEFLVPNEYSPHFKTLAGRCLNKCIEK